MRAAIFYGGKDIQVEDRPTPEPGNGEVLVKIRSAGICGSDLHGYRGHSPFELRTDAPRIGRENGHELAGEVAAIGPGVTGLSIGQRVGIEPEHLIGCGTCEYCRRGDTHICPTRGQRDGERHGSHGFSQFDACLASNVHPLPDDVSLDAAAILDCYACGVHAVHRVRIKPDSRIAILGTGAIGMTLGQVAKASGARQVIMVGTREEPLAIAREAGAADVGIAHSSVDPVSAILDLTGGHGVDAVFETVGSTAPTLEQGIQMTARGGTVCIIGVYTYRPELDVRTAYAKELTITWANSYSKWDGRSEYEIALDLLSSGRLNANPIITHHYPIEEIAEAFAAAEDKKGSGAIKVMVHPT